MIYLKINDIFQHYERWATAHGFPLSNIINDGTTSIHNSIGAVTDFQLALKTHNIDEDILVVAGDMLFDENALDISQVIRYFHNIRDKYNGNLSIYYEMENNEDASTRGIVEIDELENGKITSLFEKPADSSITSSRLASVVFYCLTRDTLPRIDDYLEAHTDIKERGFGCFVNWAIRNGTPFYGMKIPTRFQLIGNGQILISEPIFATADFKLRWRSF